MELSHLDPMALAELGRVAHNGAEKYGSYNYLDGGYDWSLAYNAAQRHMLKFWNGANNDQESGLHHLAHAAFHMLTLIAFSQRGIGVDDRPFTVHPVGGAALPIPIIRNDGYVPMNWESEAAEIRMTLENDEVPKGRAA